MKVIFWNLAKENQPITGVTRYEEELFKNLCKIKKDWEFIRIKRSKNKLFGNVVLSWIFKYRINNADIIHATYHTLAPALYFHKMKRSIITVHDLAPLVYPEIKKDISEKIQWYFTPKAISKFDKIIAISNFTRNEIIRLLKIPEEKISVVYQGINHCRYKHLDKEFCREELELDLNKRYILVVSSNVKYKRMDLVQKIIKNIREMDKDVYILKLGYGELLKGEGIINLGRISEEKMPLVYNAADVYLHTSEYEGFGLPVLEAMACGCPIVASNAASIPEVVGDAGILVNPSDVQGFVDAIYEVLTNDSLRKELSKKGLKRAKQFSWEKTAKETLRVYEEVLNL